MLLRATTLYRYFAVVGAFYQLGSMLAAALLVYLVRKRPPSFAWTLAGTACLFLAFVVWLSVVAPVNGDIAEALRTSPASVPQLWVQLQARWEGGHAAGFVLQLLRLGALRWSVLVETDAVPSEQ
jgi:hypothetical protein